MSLLVIKSSSFIILVLVILCAFVSPSNNTRENNIAKAREKRADIDLQTCIDNFDIHRDKIIRTQDSQNMGAKYLTEIDLGSREECLRLCCETENCDVFVFEEKNSGSCYLFHCGPPEDFKCKFTHHVNYSSAVLAINRHLPDLESQIKLTKHEQDLNKLRKPEVDAEPASESKTTPPTTTTTSKAIIVGTNKEMLPAETAKPAKPPEEATRKCSRYQFECRSTSECIAIYNACDGIPQCADGSDEAPELGCPETLTTATIPAVAAPAAPAPPGPAISPGIRSSNTVPVAPQKYDSNIASPPRLHALPPVLPPAEVYRSQQHMSQDLLLGPSQMQQQQQQQQQQQSQNPYQESAADFLRPITNSRPVLDPSKGQYETSQVMSQQQYRPPAAALPMQLNNGWVPHQSNQMPQQLPPYADKNSHIFNHKESGLQVPDGQEIRYNKHKGAMQYLHRALGYSSSGGGQAQYADGRDYHKVGNYYDTYRQPIQQQQQDNWAGNPSQEESYGRYAQEQPPGGRDWHQDILQPENPKHEQDKMAHELKHSKDNMDHADVGEPKIKVKIEKQQQNNNNNNNIKHITHEQQYPDVVAYKMDDGPSELQDGAAQTPGGAVLSLTLGLILTCIMALLIGCRLRVRRRMRKGGKAYAHDADYLVNGMYL